MSDGIIFSALAGAADLSAPLFQYCSFENSEHISSRKTKKNKTAALIVIIHFIEKKNETNVKLRYTICL